MPEYGYAEARASLARLERHTNGAIHVQSTHPHNDVILLGEYLDKVTRERDSLKRVNSAFEEKRIKDMEAIAHQAEVVRAITDDRNLYRNALEWLAGFVADGKLANPNVALTFSRKRLTDSYMALAMVYAEEGKRG